jgi:hypothetical protein
MFMQRVIKTIWNTILCDAHDVAPFFKDSMSMFHVSYEGSKQSVVHQNFWEIAIGDVDHN